MGWWLALAVLVVVGLLLAACSSSYGPYVYLTDQHRIDAGDLPGGAGPEHRYTVVLVDEQGVRQGDVAWNASFRVE